MTNMLRTAARFLAPVAALASATALVWFFGPEVWGWYRATFAAIVSIIPGI